MPRRLEIRYGLALAAILLASCSQRSEPPAINIVDAWARATAPGQTSTAVYFTIRNAGGEDKLLSVASPAGQASIHSTSMTGGIVRMRSVHELDIPAHSTVALKPGGTHVMLTGLKGGLANASLVPLRLTFAKSGDMKIVATVQAQDEGMVM